MNFLASPTFGAICLAVAALILTAAFARLAGWSPRKTPAARGRTPPPVIDTTDLWGRLTWLVEHREALGPQATALILKQISAHATARGDHHLAAASQLIATNLATSPQTADRPAP